MKALALTLAMLTGCMSTTYLTVTQGKDDQKQCVPAGLVGGDVVLGGAATLMGITQREPLLIAGGGAYLALASMLMFAQMADCQWLH